MRQAQAKVGYSHGILVILLVTAVGISPAMGAENGTGLYLLGYQSSMAGYQPDPGLYLRSDFYVYQGNAEILPFPRRLVIALRSRVIAEVATAAYVTPLEIFGAHYGAAIFWPVVADCFLKGRAQLDARFLNFDRTREGEYTGVGDLVVTPFSFGWHLGQFHITALGDFYAPVGSYNVHRVLNTGLNRWAVEPNLAVTWLQPKYGQEFTVSLGYTVNFENPATHYRTGNELHLEYFLGQHLPRGFTLGLAGYLYEQLTRDRGPGARLGAFHGETIALGPCLTFDTKIAGHSLSFNARYYNEVKVRNRLDGQSCFGTFTLGF